VAETRPISWLVLEPGHKVVDANGEEVGQVEEVLGDTVADIFDGLAVSSGVFGKPRYVPAELVGTIDTEALHLTIASEALEQLEEHDPPAAP
jgi:hypothetical protein